MTDQHEKVLREFVQHATDIFNLSKEPVELIGTSREDIEALTALLDKREHNRRAEPVGLRELIQKWRRYAKLGHLACAIELEAALANTEPSVPVSLSQVSELKNAGSMNSDTYQSYPDRILRAADEILFQFESYAVNKTPWPALKELAAIIKKWEPFLLTTEGVTLSVERYNELIEKEDKFDHLGCMSISTDGALIKDYTIKEPSVPVSRLEAAVKHIAFTHGENGSGGFSYIIWEDVEKLIAEARSHE